MDNEVFCSQSSAYISFIILFFDSLFQRKEDRLNGMEKKRLYLQLHEAMEALLHICKDGCRTIGPHDKVLKGSQVAYGFPAGKGLETLVHHFSNCKTRVPGGCVHLARSLFAGKHETSIFASMPFIVWGKYMISPIPTCPKKKWWKM